jgi:hypothetical protein
MKHANDASAASVHRMGSELLAVHLSGIPMHLRRFKELPRRPPGESGWPWTERVRLLRANMQDGRPWPKITIVTSAYNLKRIDELAQFSNL